MASLSISSGGLPPDETLDTCGLGGSSRIDNPEVESSSSPATNVLRYIKAAEKFYDVWDDRAVFIFLQARKIAMR